MNLVDLLCDETDSSLRMELLESLVKGLQFYVTNLFADSGRPRFQFAPPVDYPADIYCSGESLTLLCDIEHVSGMLNPELLAHVRRLRRKIVRWTVNHMQNRDGSFCYRLYTWGRINPRSIRWGQAIMLKALARLLLYETKSKD